MGETPELLRLPPPIALYYFASENTHDASAIGRCFASDATVRDENQTIRGLAAIRAWRSEAGRKYAHRVEPLEVAHNDGRIIVRGRVSGNFPGSPIVLDHIFALTGDRIVLLEIG